MRNLNNKGFLILLVLMIPVLIFATRVEVSLFSGSWASEVSWNITNDADEIVAESGVYVNNTTYTDIINLPAGNYLMNAFDSYADGWNGEGWYNVTPDFGTGTEQQYFPAGAEQNTAFVVGNATTPIFGISPLTWDFDQVLVDQDSEAQTFTIVNYGIDSFSISSIAITGDADQFTILNDLTYPIVVSDSEFLIDVVFHPTSEGLKNATMTIEDGMRVAHEISLLGMGFVAPPGDTIEDPILVAFEADSYTDSGNTNSFSDNYMIPGTEGDDNDAVYTFTIDGHKAVTISLENSTYNTKLAIYNDGDIPADDNYVAYSNSYWDGEAWADQSKLNALSMMPGTYVVIIDGEGDAPTGDYQLDILLEEPPTPEAPTFVEPVNGAFYVDLEIDLSWSNSNYTSSVDLYFGTDEDPELVLASDLPIETYTPATLEGNTDYFWKVVCKNITGDSTSEVWSFRTGGEEPPVYHLLERFNVEVPANWTSEEGWLWMEYYDSWGVHYTMDGTGFVYSDETGDLASPVMDLSAQEVLYLEWDQVIADYPTGAHNCDVMVFDGTDWVTVYASNPPGGGSGSWYSGAAHMQINVTDYINSEFQVKFVNEVITTSWTSYWAVDNFSISSPAAEPDTPVSPENVLAVVNEENTEVLVTWEAPGEFNDYLISYDDGMDTTSSIYFDAGQASAVRFTPAGYPCTLASGLINVTDGTGYGTLPSSFAAVIYADDGVDGLPGTELASISVTATDWNWVEVDLSNEGIVIEDGDFYIAYTQTGTMVTSLPHPASENNPTGNSYYGDGETWSQETGQNNLIRAIVNGPQGRVMLSSESENHSSSKLPDTNTLSWHRGSELQVEVIASIAKTSKPEFTKTHADLNKKYREERTILSETNKNFRTYTSIGEAEENRSNRSLEGYLVYRLLEADMDNEESWIQLTADAIPETSYNDTDWASVEMGVYLYAVKSVYTGDIMSDAAFTSSYVANDMHTEVTFEITTNAGDSPEGADVTLTCSDNNPAHVYTAISTADGFTFPTVWRGIYTVNIDLDGFEIYEDSHLLWDNDLSVAIELTELMAAPMELTCDATSDNEVTLNWLAPGSITGIMEGFDQGVFPPEDWNKYEYAEGNGFELSTENNSPFGTGSLYHADLNNDCDDWVVTPQISLTSDSELSFNEQNQYVANWYIHHGIWISTGSGNPADGDFVLVQEFDEVTDIWAERIVDLAEYTGNAVYIAFKYEGNFASRWFVDDVVVASVGTSRALLGYNIYRDDVLVNDAPVLETTYVDGYVTAGTYTYSVTAEYSTGSSEAVVVEDVVVDGTEGGNDVVTVTSLFGNYPNPFNPSTKISFALTQSDQNTEIVIYNIKGQQVKSLLNEQLEAGNHSVIWNGTDDSNNSVSSGIYFYKMKSGKFVSTRKMILMK